jgi:hypothetical protein
VPKFEQWAAGESEILSKLGELNSEKYGFDDMAQPEFFNEFLKLPLRPREGVEIPNIGSEPLFIPEDRMFEHIGSISNPDKMGLLNGKVNSAKGFINSGNHPMAARKFRGLVNLSFSGRTTNKEFVTQWMLALRDVRKNTFVALTVLIHCLGCQRIRVS